MAKSSKNPQARSSAPSRHAQSEPFSLVVCNAIRHHVAELAEATRARKLAFEERDVALEALDDNPDDHAEKERHSDAVRKIETISKRIKWHQGQIEKTVAEADSPGFDFVYEMPEDREIARRRADAKQGRIDAPDGATVDELDIPSAMKARLVENGFETIAQLRDLFGRTGREITRALKFLDKQQVWALRAAVANRPADAGKEALDA